jgi:hypothetical protein
MTRMGRVKSIYKVNWKAEDRQKAAVLAGSVGMQ